MIQDEFYEIPNIPSTAKDLDLAEKMKDACKQECEKKVLENKVDCTIKDFFTKKPKDLSDPKSMWYCIVNDDKVLAVKESLGGAIKATKAQIGAVVLKMMGFGAVEQLGIGNKWIKLDKSDKKGASCVSACKKDGGDKGGIPKRLDFLDLAQRMGAFLRGYEH